MLTNTDQGDLRGHGRRKDFCKEGGTMGFFQNFSRGCQKWQNLHSLIQNYEKKLFAKIFNIQGVSRPSPPPFRRPCTWTQHG